MDALASEGGEWTLGATKKLHLLDSFLKESLRLLAPEGRKYHGQVLETSGD